MTHSYVCQVTSNHLIHWDRISRVRLEPTRHLDLQLAASVLRELSPCLQPCRIALLVRLDITHIQAHTATNVRVEHTLFLDLLFVPLVQLDISRTMVPAIVSRERFHFLLAVRGGIHLPTLGLVLNAVQAHILLTGPVHVTNARLGISRHRVPMDALLVPRGNTQCRINLDFAAVVQLENINTTLVPLIVTLVLRALIRWLRPRHAPHVLWARPLPRNLPRLVIPAQLAQCRQDTLVRPVMPILTRT